MVQCESSSILKNIAQKPIAQIYVSILLSGQRVLMDLIQSCVLNLGVKKAILSLSQTPQTFESLKNVLRFESLTGSALQKPEHEKMWNIQMLPGAYLWQFSS